MLYYELVNLLPKPQRIGSMAYCLVIKNKTKKHQLWIKFPATFEGTVSFYYPCFKAFFFFNCSASFLFGEEQDIVREKVIF